MYKTTTNTRNLPANGQLDPEVRAFRQQFDGRSPLDEIIHEGARRLLQAVIDAEVDAFIEAHQDRRDSGGWWSKTTACPPEKSSPARVP